MTAIVELQSLLALQLSFVEDPLRRKALESILVIPREERREWDYGILEERYPYWVVAEEPLRHIILVYCDQGFGPRSPWGFLFTDDPDFNTLGMDSQWCWYLEEAFVRSGLWKGPVKPGYEEVFHTSPEKRLRGHGSAA